MSNFFRWLADVGPTLGRRSKSRWADVGSHRRADGCADVGPTLARRQHAIWAGVLTCFTLVHLIAIAGLWSPLNNYFGFGIVFTALCFVLNYMDENLGGGGGDTSILWLP